MVLKLMLCPKNTNCFGNNHFVNSFSRSAQLKVQRVFPKRSCRSRVAIRLGNRCLPCSLELK